MITRVIFEGNVYYKVADLASLFEVSPSTMRNRVKKANVGTRLSGFGRAVFVMESDVAKIEANGQVKVLETEFTADPVKHEYAMEVRPQEKKRKSKETKESAEKVVEPSMDSDKKNEFDALIKEAKQYAKNLLNAGKMDVADEIWQKHLGKGKLLDNATIDDIEQIKSALPELKTAVAELEESQKFEEIVVDTANQLAHETELTAQLQI
ncbi:hypothetical protein [Neobacillus mesonae]|uniref:Uncharacterized protein n=1 Tax=Neobacillus mesonae TaxID=1193713 RepID=A0A3Q9QVY8_9BACI|nr:hypothetical protein [Neobacillus mesonae]AZU60113.1 hypothetical protein CHR53_01870 [Neobacillus mesonae]